MLNFFRQHTNRIIWILVISFILWGVGTGVMSRQSGNKYVGEIFGKKIKMLEFQNAYKTIYLSPRVQAMLNENADINETFLIEATFEFLAFLKEAHKRGLTASNQEVQQEIIRRFARQGTFNPQIYERWVRNVAGQQLRTYEEGVRSELIVQKLVASIKDSIMVTDKEVEDFYYHSKRAVKVSYVTIPFDNFKKDITYTNDDLSNFYQDNTQLYKTKPNLKIEYVRFPLESFVKDVQVSDEQLVEYFNNNKDQFVNKNTADIPLFDDIKDRVKQELIKKRARTAATEAAVVLKNKITNPDMFKATVETNNYTLSTFPPLPADQIKANLGLVTDFKQTLQELQSKRLSIVETNKGVFLLFLHHVEAGKLKAFQSVESQVIQDYLESKEEKLARGKADSLRQFIIQNNVTLKEIAQKEDYSYNETPFFTLADNVIISREITSEIFNQVWDKKMGHITQPGLLEKSLGIFKLLEIKDPPKEAFIKEKDELKDKILSFKKMFELQQELSKIRQKANISISKDFEPQEKG